MSQGLNPPVSVLLLLLLLLKIILCFIVTISFSRQQTASQHLKGTLKKEIFARSKIVTYQSFAPSSSIGIILCHTMCTPHRFSLSFNNLTVATKLYSDCVREINLLQL